MSVFLYTLDVLMYAALGFAVFILLVALVRLSKGPEGGREALNLFLIAVIILALVGGALSNSIVSWITGKQATTKQIEGICSGVYLFATPYMEYTNYFQPITLTVVDANRYALAVGYLIYAIPGKTSTIVVLKKSIQDIYNHFSSKGKEISSNFSTSELENILKNAPALEYRYRGSSKTHEADGPWIGADIIPQNSAPYRVDVIIDQGLLNKIENSVGVSLGNQAIYLLVFPIAYERNGNITYPLFFTPQSLALPPGNETSSQITSFLSKEVASFPQVIVIKKLTVAGNSPGGWIASAIYRALSSILMRFGTFVEHYVPILLPSSGIYYLLTVPTMTSVATNKSNIASSSLYKIYFGGWRYMPKGLGTYQIGLFLLALGLIFYAIRVGMGEKDVMLWFKTAAEFLIWMTIFPFYYEFMSLLFNGIALTLGLPALSVAGPFLDSTFLLTLVFGLGFGYFVPMFVEIAGIIFCFSLSFVLFGVMKFLLAGTVLVLFPILYPLELFPFLQGAVQRIMRILNEIWIIGIVFAGAGAVFIAVMQSVVSSIIWLQAIEPFLFAILPFIALSVARKIGTILPTGLGPAGGMFASGLHAVSRATVGRAVGKIAGVGGIGGAAAGVGGAGGLGGIGGAAAGAAAAAGMAGLAMVGGGTNVTMRGKINPANIRSREFIPAPTPGAPSKLPPAKVTGPKGGKVSEKKAPSKIEGMKEVGKKILSGTKKALRAAISASNNIMGGTFENPEKHYSTFRNALKKLAGVIVAPVPAFEQSLTKKEKNFLKELRGRLVEASDLHHQGRGDKIKLKSILRPKEREILEGILDKAEEAGLITPEEKREILRGLDAREEAREKGATLSSMGELIPGGLFLRTHSSLTAPMLSKLRHGAFNAQEILEEKEGVGAEKLMRAISNFNPKMEEFENIKDINRGYKYENLEEDLKGAIGQMSAHLNLNEEDRKKLMEEGGIAAEVFLNKDGSVKNTEEIMNSLKNLDGNASKQLLEEMGEKGELPGVGESAGFGALASVLGESARTGQKVGEVLKGIKQEDGMRNRAEREEELMRLDKVTARHVKRELWKTRFKRVIPIALGALHAISGALALAILVPLEHLAGPLGGDEYLYHRVAKAQHLGWQRIAETHRSLAKIHRTLKAHHKVMQRYSEVQNKGK